MEPRTLQGNVREQLIQYLPLMWLSLAFVGGILLAAWVSLAWYVWLGLAGFVLLSGVLLRNDMPLFQARPIAYSLGVIMLFGLFLGAFRYQITVRPVTPGDIAYYNDRQYDLLVTGWVAEPPDTRDTYTNLRIQVEALDTGDGEFPVRGLILARVGINQEYHYGDRLRLRGLLETPPEGEDFSFRDYLARQGIGAYMSIAEATRLPGRGGNWINAAQGLLYSFKEQTLARIYRLFPDPEASLLAGILLGVDTGLTRAMQDAFRNTGTSHIIAISGFNIAIIAGIFVSFFSRFLGPRRGAAAAVAGILAYTLLVGADAAVIRAAMMGSLSLFARQVGRRNFGLNTLAFVALLSTLFDPLTLWDVGFQLSFFATLGLVLYAEPLTRSVHALLERFLPQSVAARLIGPLSDFVLLTLAAQIPIVPIMAYHFQRIPMVLFLANPFILPAQPAVMVIGGLAVLLSLVWFPLGQLTAWIAWPFVVYTIRVVEIFNRMPNSTIFLGDSSIWFVLTYYAALLALTLLFVQGGAFNGSRLKEWFASLGERARNLSLSAVLGALFILSLLTYRAASTSPDGQLHVTFLDAGSADAVLIQTPSGRSVLVNGGPRATELSDDLGRRLPFLNRTLDWLVVGSTYEDQLAALPRVLERYPPDHVLWSGNVQASFSARRLDEWLADRGVPVTPAETGQKLDLGEGAFLEVITEGPRGSVLLVQWNNFRALLPVGVSADTLEELEYGNAVGPVDVLLLADSGFFLTNPPDWIENLNPKLIVLSVAAGDPDGLPSDEVLESAGGYTLLRTDRSGWISVATDGVEMRVEAEVVVEDAVGSE